MSHSGIDLLQDMKQILERAGQAVEFPDDDRIAVAQVVEQAMEFRTIPPSAGSPLLVYPCAARRLQRTDLSSGVLIAGLRHAGVAEQHGKIVAQSCCLW